MFILYALFIGTVLGVILGGDVRRLSSVSFKWKGVIFAGLVFQVVLFAPAVSDRVGALGPALYVGSTLAVLAAVLRNARIPGLAVIVAGALSNLIAIVANGGYMPASSGALAALGKAVPETYSNSALVARPAFEVLTDIFALPRWLPYANVFSVGDVIIAAGVVWAIVALMRGGRPSTTVLSALDRLAVRAQQLRKVVGGASEQPYLVSNSESTLGSLAAWDSSRKLPHEGHESLHGRVVQGKPVVRRGTQS